MGYNVVGDAGRVKSRNHSITWSNETLDGYPTVCVRLFFALAVAAWMRRAAGWSWGVVLPVCWLPFEWIQTFGDAVKFISDAQ